MPALQWFTTRLPALLQQQKEQQTQQRQTEVVQCVQRAGEAIFVPEGWGHAILCAAATTATDSTIIQTPDTRSCNVMHCCATLQCAGYNHHYVGTWHLRLASPLSLRTEAGHSGLQIHSR